MSEDERRPAQPDVTDWGPRVFPRPLDMNSDELRYQAVQLMRDYVQCAEGAGTDEIPFTYPREEPCSAGFFRCFTCRRVQALTSTREEMHADYLRRHGGETGYDWRIITCDDCNWIISTETGTPI